MPSPYKHHAKRRHSTRKLHYNCTVLIYELQYITQIYVNLQSMRNSVQISKISMFCNINSPKSEVSYSSAFAGYTICWPSDLELWHFHCVNYDFVTFCGRTTLLQCLELLRSSVQKLWCTASEVMTLWRDRNVYIIISIITIIILCLEFMKSDDFWPLFIKTVLQHMIPT